MKPKTVLITGASAGIGKATTNLFAAKGWQVAATMRNPAAEKELAALETVKLYRLDVTAPEAAVTGTVDDIVTDHGRLDVLVNNAGIGVFGAFEAADFELIRRQFETNVFGLMRVTRAVLPHFRKQGAGVIVNVSSGVGRIALPMQSLYNTTKFAIEGFSESVHYELKPLGVRVKVVEPGNIKTDFFKSLTIVESEALPDYQAYQETVIANHFKLDEGGSPPEMVAAVIYRAAQDPSDRLRYPAGRDISLFLKVRRLLPETWFFKLVRRQLEK